jgi:hypothetical protein
MDLDRQTGRPIASEGKYLCRDTAVIIGCDAHLGCAVSGEQAPGVNGVVVARYPVVPRAGVRARGGGLVPWRVLRRPRRAASG